MNTLLPASAPAAAREPQQSFAQHILVCLSRSSRAAAIAAYAWQMARRYGATCQFLHAGVAAPGAARHLRAILRQANVPDDALLPVHHGSIRQAVEQAVRRHRIDLVVAGMLQERVTLKNHVDSIAGRIAAHANCSVMLLAEPPPVSHRLARVIASVDFDRLSQDMLHAVLGWARSQGLEQWHVVHEYDPSGFYSPLDGIEPESIASRTKRLGQFVRPLDCSGIHLHRACLMNKHGCDAMWYARTMRADLLCLPLSPRRQAFWERVLRFRLDVNITHLPAAVLLYRRPPYHDGDLESV